MRIRCVRGTNTATPSQDACGMVERLVAAAIVLPYKVEHEQSAGCLAARYTETSRSMLDGVRGRGDAGMVHRNEVQRGSLDLPLVGESARVVGGLANMGSFQKQRVRAWRVDEHPFEQTPACGRARAGHRSSRAVVHRPRREARRRQGAVITQVGRDANRTKRECLSIIEEPGWPEVDPKWGEERRPRRGSGMPRGRCTAAHSALPWRGARSGRGVHG